MIGWRLMSNAATVLGWKHDGDTTFDRYWAKYAMESSGLRDLPLKLAVQHIMKARGFAETGDEVTCFGEMLEADRIVERFGGC